MYPNTKEHLSHPFETILGQSPAMRRLKALLKKVADSPAPVLILGESGTGKELVARAIHSLSARRAQPFVAQSCAAIPESLLESELFGYEKGAFTDAHCSREGLFAAARNGTLFLDEIAEMSLEAQAKLLRVLETGEVRRLGDIQTHKIDVRVLAATSCDLQAAMEGGHFRPELYYRLNVLSVHLPPLRQRRQDIPLLAGHFLSAYAAKTGKSLSGFSPEVLTALRRYCWPGNVRQLRNEVERMAALAEEGAQISAGLLSGQVLEPGPRTRQDGDSLPEALRRLRESMIREALEKCGGNRTHAAALLGISRANLQRTMRRLGID